MDNNLDTASFDRYILCMLNLALGMDVPTRSYAGHICWKGTMHFRRLLSPHLLTLQAASVLAN